MLNFIISDIHFSKTKRLECISDPMREFIEILSDNTDIKKRAIISGDYFDHGFSLGDYAYKVAISYLKEIFDLCDEVLILYGTTSHDRENYVPILKFIPSHVHFFNKIEMYTSKIDGFKFLMVPEEYPDEFSNYYSEHINQDMNYDLIIGHGNIDGAKMNKYVKVDNTRLGGRSFNKNDLGSIAQEVFFGHIHLRQNLLDNVQYVGSMNKTGFGEEEEVKGYWSFVTDNKSMKVLNKKFHELKLVHDFVDIKSDLIQDIDFDKIDKREIRMVYNESSSDSDIDYAKSNGIKVKMDKKASLLRDEKSISNLKYENIVHDMKMGDKFSEALIADQKISKNLRLYIEEEIKNKFNSL